MTQYNTIKAKYPDALLLFRVGDFYETFGTDAIRASQILGIVLTKRANGEGHIELAGFPHHSVDTYLPKLVRAGLRVAICDQLEDPKTVKGIVKRGVTELVTPGVTFNEQVLSSKKNNFCFLFIKSKRNTDWLWSMFHGRIFNFRRKFGAVASTSSEHDPSEIIYQRTTELPSQLKNRNSFKLGKTGRFNTITPTKNSPIILKPIP